MNYRHAYHAGNFADVVKHATLALVIEHLKLKPAPFRIIDTHAGLGRYDLGADEAVRGGEWQGGIGRLLTAPLPPDIAEILAPYLATIAAENPALAPGAPPAVYPGSPRIARHLLRAGDQLVVNELHPDDHATLDALFARDRQTRVLALDGWAALKSLLPPKERRGIVLVDPPFEEPGELARLTQGLREAARRFATGTIILWYPIKDLRPVFAFRREVEELGLEKVLGVELLIRDPERDATRPPPDQRSAAGPTGPGLAGCGLVILNPPFLLKATLDVLIPFLASRLAQGPGARGEVRWLAPERART
jgi:23S rRNA (adenine2030-N6)-methyltransferase